ncbi:MAG: NAD(P)/FAD-dependent oxidoreductase, partial [Anaerolineae bacterium]
MDRETVIIIGAGLAGLSAGCFAQMNGYRSRIFEHHSRPGGVAAAWKRGEYLIDGGIHFVMAHKPGTGLHEL